MPKKKEKTHIPYAETVYGKEEIAAVADVLKNPKRITTGYAVRKFEKRVARLFGKKHGVMVNSGSSANLLALEVLNLPKNSEVITPVLTFATTLAPILQKGLTPVFADVKLGTYVIDVDQVEKLVTKKTKAIMAPSLIGNLPDWKRLGQIAKKHKLWLIEDSCDTLGARFAGKPTGNYSHISTTSFYASHIVTAAGGGGMVCFHDPALARRALIMANWGRESTLFGLYEKSEEIKKRFAGTLGGDAYDAKFIFSEVGYNFQPLELQGAFGLAQLGRLKKFSKVRHRNFAALFNFFKKYEKFFILPKTDPRADANWLAFPLTICSGAPFSRHALTKYLEEKDIQTRPIFTGNVLKQPAFRNIKRKVSVSGYPAADYIMKNGFLIGCHQGLVPRQIDRLKNIFTGFLNRYA